MVCPADDLPSSYASFLRAASFTYGLRRRDRKFDGMYVWKSLDKEVRLGLTWDGSTLSGLNETLARDGSECAWLCGVRAINKSHPASKPMTSAAPCASVTMGSHYLFIECYCAVFPSSLLNTVRALILRSKRLSFWQWLYSSEVPMEDGRVTLV